MIKEITREKLLALRGLLEKLSDNQLSRPLKVLNDSTIGMHLRHILEFYQCLFSALDDGQLNYDLRKRDREMERNKSYGMSCIESLLVALETNNEDKNMLLSADYSPGTGEKKLSLNTTYFRELLYNVEHCVHHLAIIKIGISELDPTMVVSSELGVAASTLRNHRLCAQ